MKSLNESLTNNDQKRSSFSTAPISSDNKEISPSELKKKDMASKTVLTSTKSFSITKKNETKLEVFIFDYNFVFFLDRIF